MGEEANFGHRKGGVYVEDIEERDSELEDISFLVTRSS